MTDQVQPLEQILGGGNPAPAESQHPDPGQAPQAADPTGAQAPAAQQQDDDDPETQAVEVGGQKMVPLAAAKAGREKVKRYTQQIAEFEKQIAESNRRSDESNRAWEQRFNRLVETLQPRQPQPAQQPQVPQPDDFFADPAAAIRAEIERAMQPVAQHINTMSEATSRRFAVAEHGQDSVTDAYAAIESRFRAGDPNAMGEYRRIMSSGDPWGELVKWHKRESAVAEMGTDPAAYREKLKAQILAELGQSAPQPQASNGAAPAAPNLPTDLARARNVAPRTGPAWSGPEPLKDIFDRRNQKAS